MTQKFTQHLLVGEKVETTTDNFGAMRRENCLLVDKTLMIHDFWLGQKVALVTPPRRFGKTMNLSYVAAFFCKRS